MQCNCFCVVEGVGTGLGLWELLKFYSSIFGVDFGKAWIGVWTAVMVEQVPIRYSVTAFAFRKRQWRFEKVVVFRKSI